LQKLQGDVVRPALAVAADEAKVPASRRRHAGDVGVCVRDRVADVEALFRNDRIVSRIDQERGARTAEELFHARQVTGSYRRRESRDVSSREAIETLFRRFKVVAV